MGIPPSLCSRFLSRVIDRGGRAGDSPPALRAWGAESPDCITHGTEGGPCLEEISYEMGQRLICLRPRCWLSRQPARRMRASARRESHLHYPAVIFIRGGNEVVSRALSVAEPDIQIDLPVLPSAPPRPRSWSTDFLDYCFAGSWAPAVLALLPPSSAFVSELGSTQLWLHHTSERGGSREHPTRGTLHLCWVCREPPRALR